MSPSPEAKFDRCPKCYAVIKYNAGDAHIICPKCNVKIKLAATNG